MRPGRSLKVFDFPFNFDEISELYLAIKSESYDLHSLLKQLYFRLFLAISYSQKCLHIKAQLSSKMSVNFALLICLSFCESCFDWFVMKKRGLQHLRAFDRFILPNHLLLSNKILSHNLLQKERRGEHSRWTTTNKPTNYTLLFEKLISSSCTFFEMLKKIHENTWFCQNFIESEKINQYSFKKRCVTNACLATKAFALFTKTKRAFSIDWTIGWESRAKIWK